VDEKTVAKANFIKAYFDDLQSRIAFLPELYEMRRKDEALMLCCCYIEALGSRQSRQPERKAANYCAVLAEQGKNEIWRLIHPKQLRNVLADNGLFKPSLQQLEPVINQVGNELIEPEYMRAKLDPMLNHQQRRWVGNNLFKGTIAYISYERIRSELVHDISGGPISFSETFYKGNPVPELDFDILYASLRHIVASSQELAISRNKWWFEE
jgi:hypothetical protein